MEGDAGNVQEKLDRFLLCYRNTPHTATGESPAKMLKGYTLRTKLDLLKPDKENESRSIKRNKWSVEEKGDSMNLKKEIMC